MDAFAEVTWRLAVRPARTVARAARALRSGGPAGMVRHAARELRDARDFGRSLDSRYRRWVDEVAQDFSRVPDAELFAEVARAPRFLLVAWLPSARMDEVAPVLRSLRQQPYPHWHLWLVAREPIDERSEERIYNRVPGEKRLHLAKRDPARPEAPWDRARVVNDIVAAAPHTTHVGFVELGDRLAPESLLRLTERIFADDPDVLYVDEDQEMPWGRRASPRLKPEWSPEFLLSYHYFGHLALYRRDLFLAAGGLRSGEDGRLEYDLALRATERASRVSHVAHVLCHRSAHKGPGFRAVLGSEEGAAGAERILADALARRGVECRVEPGRLPGTWRVRPAVPAGWRAVIAIATRDRPELLRRTIRRVERHTRGDAWELVVVDCASRQNRTRRYLESLPHRVIADPGPWNRARLMNVAARATGGDVIVFLESGSRVREGWLDALLEALAIPGVGAAGARVTGPAGLVRGAGIVLGVEGIAGLSHGGLPVTRPGYLGSLQVLRNYSAAGANGLAVTRAAFELAGGFDEAFAARHHDIDFCLRLASRGLRTVVTPWCGVIDPGKPAPDDPAHGPEAALLRARWAALIEDDPAYHPLLSREAGDFQLARWRRRSAGANVPCEPVRASVE